MKRSRALLAIASLLLLSGCTRSQAGVEKRASPTPSGSAAASGSTAKPASVAASASVALPAASERKSCLTPESAGVGPLLALSGESSGERAALAAARRELTRLLEVPAEYFGSVQTAGDLVLVELWHRSAFPPDGCVAPGGSGAKRRILGYDLRKQRIVSSKVWEPLEGEPRAESPR